MSTTTAPDGAKTAAAPKAQPREPTPDQRLKIRNLLDGHFDDGKGCYLDGYSDQRIGEEVGVPWAVVAKIREAGWGPIKTDPELSAAQAELAKLREAMVALVERHNEERRALGAKLDSLAAKLDALSRKRVGAAA